MLNISNENSKVMKSTSSNQLVTEYPKYHFLNESLTGYLKSKEPRITNELITLINNNEQKNDHFSGSFSNEVLRELEKILPLSVENSIETGCGKSTILFSNISNNHYVFTFDDRKHDNSSVEYFQKCNLTKNSRIKTFFGPTQVTLREYSEHKKYDIVLLDGPHGYPFVEFEYLMLNPHIKEGGFLIIDDVIIPTIGRMADIIAEDLMFDLIAVIEATAIFCRTNSITFSPIEDNWSKQIYNKRRIPWFKKEYINDGIVFDKISTIFKNR